MIFSQSIKKSGFQTHANGCLLGLLISEISTVPAFCFKPSKEDTLQQSHAFFFVGKVLNFRDIEILCIQPFLNKKA